MKEMLLKYKVGIFLAFIISVAGFLRLWQLGSVPLSPDWDEVALGYNSYSILQTGKDEYGKAFPFVLRSYDDYKPALYAYLAIPTIKLFGLNVFAVRLPSAIFGILTVLVTYFLVKELFKSSQKQNSYALIASFLLAISPWHIQFSRIAFESNVGLAFNVLGIFLFLKGLKKPIYLLFAAAILGLCVYIYQSDKVFTPLIILAMAIIYRRELFVLPKKYLFLTVFIGIIIALPMSVYTLTSKEGLARAEGVSIFSNTTVFLSENVKRLQVDKERGDFLGLVLDNRRVLYVKEIVAGYISHFDLNWLFIKGDISRHHAPDMGLLYLWELPFLFIGIYLLIFGSFDRKTKILLFAWFLIAPIPASITSDVPHAVRTLNFLPTFQIFIAIGIISVLSQIFSIKYRYFLASCFLFLVSFNIFYYLNQYFVQQNYFYALDWQYGYKEIIDHIKPIQHNYKKIIVSDSQDMSQSYMFFLFYLGYDPKKYLLEGGTRTDGNNKFSNFEFKSFEYNNEHNVLLVGSVGDFPESVEALYTIYYLDKTPAIKIVEKH